MSKKQGTNKPKEAEQKKIYSSCPVCLEQIEEKDRYILSCTHEFHSKCIDQWMRSNLIFANRDSKQWAFLLMEPKLFGLRTNYVIGLLDSGDFSCPICMKNFTLMHPKTISKHLSTDKIEPIEYEIKIKYSGDSAPINSFWYSQYIHCIEEFEENLIPANVDGDSMKIYNSITQNAYIQNIMNVRKWCEEKSPNDKLILHALNCNCNKDTCLGYFFVKEANCPVCKDNSGLPISNHISHITPKQLTEHIERWAKIFNKEMTENIFTFEGLDSDTDINSDTDANSDIDSELLDDIYIPEIDPNNLIRIGYRANTNGDQNRSRTNNQTTTNARGRGNAGGGPRGRARARGRARGRGRGRNGRG